MKAHIANALAAATLVGVEAFVLFALILWPVAALAHLGVAVEHDVLIVAGLCAVGAGFLMFRIACRNDAARED